MKKLLGLLACTCLSAVLVFGTTGCPDKKDKDKTVKVTEKTTKTTETTTDKEKTEKTTTTETKKWTVKPSADVTVTQGDTATVTIDITRDKYADPVDLKFAGLPDGVTAVEKDKDWTIAKDATSAKFTLKAAADAKPVTDQKVTVTATSGTATQESSFKVTVKKKAEAVKPDDKTAKPDDKTTKPDDKTTKPDDKTKKPDDKTKKPDDKTKKPDDKNGTTSLQSFDAIIFYALLNDRFLAPVYAIRNLQVSYHCGRNDPYVTA